MITGWYECDTQIDGVSRSVFNLDVSRDGKTLQRKHRLETEKSYQYPTFRERRDAIYPTDAQGNDSPIRKETILFGRLERSCSTGLHLCEHGGDDVWRQEAGECRFARKGSDLLDE